MTDSTQSLRSAEQRELAVLEQMSREVCGTCLGDDLLMQNGEGDKPCLNCRDTSGIPTGCKWPGFSKECSIVPHNGSHHLHVDCQGSGRCPVSVAEARCWAEDYLLEHCKYVQLIQSDEDFVLMLGTGKPPARGDTPFLAMAAAMSKVK